MFRDAQQRSELLGAAQSYLEQLVCYIKSGEGCIYALLIPSVSPQILIEGLHSASLGSPCTYVQY